MPAQLRLLFPLNGTKGEVNLLTGIAAPLPWSHGVDRTYWLGGRARIAGNWQWADADSPRGWTGKVRSSGSHGRCARDESRFLFMALVRASPRATNGCSRERRTPSFHTTAFEAPATQQSNTRPTRNKPNQGTIINPSLSTLSRSIRRRLLPCLLPITPALSPVWTQGATRTWTGGSGLSSQWNYAANWTNVLHARAVGDSVTLESLEGTGLAETLSIDMPDPGRAFFRLMLDSP